MKIMRGHVGTEQPKDRGFFLTQRIAMVNLADILLKQIDDTDCTHH